jgi:hypothetical protein
MRARGVEISFVEKEKCFCFCFFSFPKKNFCLFGFFSRVSASSKPGGELLKEDKVL